MSSFPSFSDRPSDTAPPAARRRSRPRGLRADLERNLGEQPLAGILSAGQLTARALVEASPDFLTFKMVSRAVRGRRLTPGAQHKILAAVMAATGKTYAIGDLFTYGDEATGAGDADPGQIGITTFAESERDLRAVRDEVFGREQSVPRDLDWDGTDAQCVHALALDRRGRPIGTGRLQPDGRIGRLAVVRSWRQRGIGGRVLEALVDAARARGMAGVFLHAQIQVADFYARRGFEREGPEFPEAGIRHVVMRRRFPCRTPPVP